MTILGLDFTSEHGSLAVRRDGQTLVNYSIHSPDGFAHLLFDALDRVLREAGVRLPDIDCFAAASGPGAFTGVRVGLSAVKGLAEATGQRAIGVSNLRALASFGSLPLRAAVLDARRGDVFTAIYDAHLQPVLPEAVGKLHVFLDNLPSMPDEVITQSLEWLRTAPESARFANIPLVEAPRGLAAAVAQCAEQDMRDGATGDPATLDANYVRRSDAEMFWKDA